MLMNPLIFIPEEYKKAILLLNGQTIIIQSLILNFYPKNIFLNNFFLMLKENVKKLDNM